MFLGLFLAEFGLGRAFSKFWQSFLVCKGLFVILVTFLATTLLFVRTCLDFVVSFLEFITGFADVAEHLATNVEVFATFSARTDLALTWQDLL